MEAIAGLSLAANILQVIEFAANLLLAGHQIHKTGSTVQNAELELVTNDLVELNDKLMSWTRPDAAASGPLEKESQLLENLATESANIAQELVALLQSICIQGTPSRYKSLLQAIRTSWSDKKVKETQKRLQTIRDELQFRVLISLKEDNIRSLNEADRTTLAHVIESNRALRTQTDHIAAQQKADAETARQRHSEIMAAVSQHQIPTHHTIDVTNKIKRRLYSPRQDDRADDIAIAHQSTFNWALQDQTSNQSWSSLTKWLREDGDVYWVSGKAGSGKSTLMKYLRHDPRMMQELKWWARDGHLIVGSFYFWNSDAKIQRSQEGLFRSLLWQILDQDASCGSALFPDLYQSEAEWEEFPTFHQLRRAFRRLETMPGTTKIVLIVDGLDEFDAVGSTMTELAELFLFAGTSPNLKALVSSRPLSAFEAAFENQPKLRLHELTSNDITLFVDDRLGKHPQIAELAAQSPVEIQALVKEIVYAASGVFLWVKLVVDSLLEGLRNQDTVPALQNRLKKLPKDLEALFEHLLHGIPSEYKLESSRYFQLLRCYNQAPNDTSLSALALFYVDTPENIVFETRVEAISPLERARIEELMRRKLRSHCVGLLELQPRSSSRDMDTNQDRTITQVTQDVTYLHRSVSDYLAREEVWREIVRHTESTSFHAPQALLKSSVMEIKVSVFAPASSNLCSPEIELWQLVLNAIHFASLIAEATSMTSLALLDDLDEALSSHFKSNPTTLGRHHSGEKIETWCGTWFDDFRRRTNSQDNFLTFTTEQGLESYVCEKLKQNPKCMKKSGRPLLDYACNSGPGFNLLRPKIVQALLRNGADPNERFQGQSPWMNILVAYRRDLGSYYREGLENFHLRISVIREMLHHGADPNASIANSMRFGKRDYRKYRQSALRHIRWISDEHLEGQLVREDRSATTDIITEEQAREQHQAMKGLIKLLITKGAKDREWHEVAGTFIQIGGLRSKSYNLLSRLRDISDDEVRSNQQRWGRAFLFLPLRCVLYNNVLAFVTDTFF